MSSKSRHPDQHPSEEMEQFLASCRQAVDYVRLVGESLTIYTAVERPLRRAGAQHSMAWAGEAGVTGFVFSNLLSLDLNGQVTKDQVLEQLELARQLPLREGIAEVLDPTGLWPDLAAHAEVFIREKGELCDVFSHLRDPILNVPRSHFRWVE